jgi:hypothetical protein
LKYLIETEEETRFQICFIFGKLNTCLVRILEFIELKLDRGVLDFDGTVLAKRLLLLLMVVCDCIGVSSRGDLALRRAEELEAMLTALGMLVRSLLSLM